MLEYSWFREIVSQNTYTATLPDGSTQIWQNTNAFLDPTSEYYNENVCGIKTGSLSDDYNLIVLYQQHRRLLLVMSRNYQEGIRCSSRGLTRSKRNTGALRQYRQSSGMRFILEPELLYGPYAYCNVFCPRFLFQYKSHPGQLPLVMSRNYQEGIRCSSRGLTRSKRKDRKSVV